jgi:chondroitin AC lyase
MISRKVIYFSIPLLCLLLSGCFDHKVKFPEELRQLHQNVWENILDVEIDEENVDLLLETLTDAGQWPGIDYEDKTRGAWSTRNHLRNLVDITIAYQSKGSKYYRKDEVSKKVQLALNLWLENDFLNPNWWHPDIGTPMMIAPVMVLMEAELTEEQMEMGYVILERSKMGKTGQNKVWLAGNVLFTSLLKKDIDTIKLASQAIQEELVVSMKEGVQPDWSYHQHGPQIQFGNYGLSYVNDMIKWITILRNTPFQFDEQKVSILRDYVLNGQRWITWKNQLDISACGRQLFIDSPELKAASLASHFTRMERLDPEFTDAYKQANQYETLSGHKHFWRSDFQVWRNPEYYFSLKMCSERVIGAESCNSENIQGYYMGDGATFLYQSGEEYRNIFPFLDWKKIPGTTTMQDDDPLPVLTARGYRIESDFVGGVSDGEIGVAALDYNRNGLQARKSWFMFDGKIICLGAGISSKTGLTVTTGVNQTYLNGEATLKIGEQISSVEGKQTLKSPSWILHDNLGYIFPDGGNLVLQAENIEGSWNWVARRYPDERMEADLFKLWFDHGKNPQDGSYEYILVPGADKEQLESLEKDFPFEISNEIYIQAVLTKDKTLAGIIFYRAGKFDRDYGIEVNKPCVMMLRKKPEGLQVSIADPTQMEKEIQITFKGEFTHDHARVENGKTIVSVTLPQGEEAGKTITLDLRYE